MLDFSRILKNLLSAKNLDLNSSNNSNNNNSSCWDSFDDLATREESSRSGDPVKALAETGLEASGWSLSTGDLCLTDWDSIISLLVNSGPTREVQEANFAWMDEGVSLRRGDNHGQQGSGNRSGTSVPSQRGYALDPSEELLDPSIVDAAGAPSMISAAAQQFLDSLPDISYVLC